MFRQFCHHQGVTHCLAKITIYIIVRAMRSLCYGYVATCQWKECFLISIPSTDMLPHNHNIVIA